MTSPIVFLDFASPDATRLKAFYSDVFGWNANAEQFTIPVSTPMSASIREDPTEKRIYLGVSDVASKLAEIQAHGGSIDADRFEVGGVAVLGLFKDPAGNPMGLVEMADGKPIIP